MLSSYFTRLIYIASDHAGFKRKEYIKRFLAKRKILFSDLGPARYAPLDDYPDYASQLARMVQKTKARGILLCGSAIGVCVVANKFRGIRAAIGYNTYAARTARADDDANVLCLPGKVFSNNHIEQILATWLKTRFSGLARHKRRLAKIKKIETQ